MILLDLVGTRQTRFGNWFPQTAHLYSRMSLIGQSPALSIFIIVVFFLFFVVVVAVQCCANVDLVEPSLGLESVDEMVFRHLPCSKCDQRIFESPQISTVPPKADIVQITLQWRV